MSHESRCCVSWSKGHAAPESLRPVAYRNFVEHVQPDEGTVSPVRKKEMQSVVEVGSLGIDTRLPTKRSSRRGAFLRWLRSITHLGSGSLETTIGRAVEQAFAEFAKEMQR
jgi:hypothetical protein